MSTLETDSHERLLFEFERTEARVSYIVCSIPRSGSSLLCELLGSTGLAGAPAEFLHPDKMSMLQRRWEAPTLDDYLRELLARKTSPNGVFGAKAHLGQYDPLFGDADPRRFLPEPQLVFITRREQLRQAISWVRALQTQEWVNQNSPKPQRPAVFDPEHITRKMRRIQREEEQWESLFARHSIVPHRVVYEDFIDAQEETVRGVLHTVGVDAPADLSLPPPVHDRQADELSDEWVERFQAEAEAAP